jgi:5-(carboxyamino)imidazole ribonucleotide mutase
MGSNSDLQFAEKIKTALAPYSIACELRIASAHRTPEHLLRILRDYSGSGDQIIVVSVAGLSDALSGVIAAQRLFPVVACPPDIDKFGSEKVFSSAFTPSDVPVAFVNEPTKAANFVAQIFAMSNPKIAEVINSKTGEKKKQVQDMDLELQNK